MTPGDRELGERVLRHLCEGAVVGGIRFGGVPQLLVDHRTRRPVRGQVYVNLGSRWTVFDKAPAVFPASEEQLPERPIEEGLHLLCSIRERIIVRADLGEDGPHLIFTFDDGAVFFLNGNHPQYESWDVGVALGDSSETWLVVACPGGEIAIWSPPSFKDERRAG